MCSIFSTFLFIVHRSYQLAFILGCFWLIGTTFDCHKLPHKNDFHKREKIIKGGRQTHLFIHAVQGTLSKKSNLRLKVQTKLSISIQMIHIHIEPKFIIPTGDTNIRYHHIIALA